MPSMSSRSSGLQLRPVGKKPTLGPGSSRDVAGNDSSTAAAPCSSHPDKTGSGTMHSSYRAAEPVYVSGLTSSNYVSS